MATRSAYFYISSKAVAGLGNIMSWGMSQLNGHAGLEGWVSGRTALLTL